MRKINYVSVIICMFLIISIPIVSAIPPAQQAPYPQNVQSYQQPGVNQPYPTGPFYSNPNPYSTPASFQTDPYFGGSFGGYAYNSPYQDTVRRATGGYSFGQEQYIGEAIILNVADYEPKQVRQSLLEQQDVPVFMYLKGTTVGTLLSPFSDDPSARDPLTTITNLPPIDYIDVRPNITGNATNYVRFVNYIPPRRDKYSLNNLGYLIVYLRKLESENATPKDNTIELDLNAKIFLKLEEGSLFGMSQQGLTLKQFQNHTQFLDKKDDYSFFTNKGYLRATRVGVDSVTVQVYNKDLYPLAIAPLSGAAVPAPTTTGIQTRNIITLRKGEISQPISFAYTGNPLTDMFRVRLDDVSIPADKAEIEYELNGIKTTRKVAVGSRIHPTSNWVLFSVNNNQTKPITQSNIEEITKQFNLRPQQRNQIVAFLNNNQHPQVQTHRIELQNIASGERKIVIREIVIDNGTRLGFDQQVISKDTADFLETKYCGGNDNVEPTTGRTLPNGEPERRIDVGCQASRLYKELIVNSPNSVEARKAKKDLAEIYEDQLIEFKPCTRVIQNTGNQDDKDSCTEFEFDMNDLALYYYEQIGEKERMNDRFGARGGEDYLQDEGVIIQLKRVITLVEEQPTFFMRVYQETGQFYEIPQGLHIGDRISLTGSDQPTQVIYPKANGTFYWCVESINPSAVTVRLYNNNTAGSKPNGTTCSEKYRPAPEPPRSLKLNERNKLEKEFQPINPQTNQPTGPPITTDVEVTNIDSRYEAYVTVLPGAGRAFTTSNFRIHIPIDPRPFKLTPEQLESQINTTRKLIEDLNKVITKLDSYISTLKKICLGVFAFLTVKNAFGGVRNIARREVSTHFKERCQTEVREGRTEAHEQFRTIDQCLNHYSDEIKESTDRAAEHIDDINDKLKGKTADEITDNIASEAERGICGNFTSVDQASIGMNNADKVRNYRDCMLQARIAGDTSINENYRNYAREKASEIGTKERSELYQQAVEFARANNLNHTDPSVLQDVMGMTQEIREAQREQQPYRVRLTSYQPGDWQGTVLIPNPTASTPTQQISAVKARGLSRFDQLVINTKGHQPEIDAALCNFAGGKINSGVCNRRSGTGNINATELQRARQNMEQQPATVQAGLPHQPFVSEEYYTTILTPLKTGTQPTVNQQTCEQTLNGEWSDNFCKPKTYSSTASLDTAGRVLNTAYTPGGNLTAEYNSDGLAYCYPTGKGEYILILKRFEGNNLPRFVKIMNVGPNGRIECGRGDDEIAQGGDESELERNPQKKQSYISKIQKDRCTREGETVGTIDYRRVKCTMQTSEALNALTQPKCIDVMDPVDCKLLFNFCDPVMCPSSRCNLGGHLRGPPRNVIQSGIIGSTILCAPNIKEGIVLPVCLTGIDAGLKNIRSILEGYANCLEINLKQGKNVGFCDYIRSVGICEMVWREAYNLLDIGGRGLIDWASGKIPGVPEGGGEYLSFQASLENVGDSVEVFTQEYSTTYTAQFLSQSTEEIGSQICRLSVNGKLPGVGKILDSLTEPENPPQFQAFFDEVPYAAPGETPGLPNVPPGTQELSLYKTFYHIYAGTGFYQGSYSQPQSLFAPGTQLGTPQPIVYSVYLVGKEMGLQPLYVTFPGEFTQFQGRIEQGKYAQESVQKIGPKGYNQVCVNINGIESCGFGKVSSSFGLNELKDYLSKEEAEEVINSADECIPSSQRTQGQSAAALGALGAAQLVGGGLASGVVTSGVVETNLYSRGITRVCSVGEPTQETGRWQQVGSCGADENNKTRGNCWLDMKSVRIEDLNMNNELLTELQRRARPGIELIDADRSQEILFSLNEERNNILDQVRSIVQKNKRIQQQGIITEIIPASAGPVAGTTSAGTTTPTETPIGAPGTEDQEDLVGQSCGLAGVLSGYVCVPSATEQELEDQGYLDCQENECYNEDSSLNPSFVCCLATGGTPVTTTTTATATTQNSKPIHIRDYDVLFKQGKWGLCKGFFAQFGGCDEDDDYKLITANYPSSDYSYVPVRKLAEKNYDSGIGYLFSSSVKHILRDRGYRTPNWYIENIEAVRLSVNVTHESDYKYTERVNVRVGSQMFRNVYLVEYERPPSPTAFEGDRPEDYEKTEQKTASYNQAVNAIINLARK